MLKYAKIVNEETKQCEVGIGTNTNFYKSIGMIEMEVEQAYDGNWYVKGYVPEKPTEVLAQEKRAERNAILDATDKFTSVPDYPITDEKREQYKAYRQYLRDLPEQESFPNVEIMTFEKYVESITQGE